jgi:hypothetical protein
MSRRRSMTLAFASLMTMKANDVIAAAAERLGGVEQPVEWVREDLVAEPLWQ